MVDSPVLIVLGYGNEVVEPFTLEHAQVTPGLLALALRSFLLLLHDRFSFRECLHTSCNLGRRLNGGVAFRDPNVFEFAIREIDEGIIQEADRVNFVDRAGPGGGGPKMGKVKRTEGRKTGDVLHKGVLEVGQHVLDRT